MKLFQVDAFTTKPFTGNPAGVCILSETIPDSDMLKIAKERNLPKTAFLYKNDSGYNLRWFTPPQTEIELCGHATLAAAHILWETGDLAQDERASFDFVAFPLSERGGVIKIRVKSNRVILSGYAVTVINGEILYK
jgi:PhzF family phenazine biosynthesis protein